MIMPCLRGARLSYWNTNQWALMGSIAAKEPDAARNVYLNPERKLSLSSHARQQLSADQLYGGYLEDRSFLWKGSYMDPSKFLHLGIDITAPAGADVQLDEDAQLVQIYQDPPGDTEGWGTRLLFKLLDYDDIHLVYGHLAPISILMDWMQVGNRLRAGLKIGSLGTREQNGGWAPHLHVQAILGDVREFLDKPELLDGYGELRDFAALAKRFPDPMRYISFR